MSKYMVFDLKDIQSTEYDYEIGEVITVNSNSKYKCMGITTKNDNIYYMFNIGIPKYEYKEMSSIDIKRFEDNIK